MRTIATALACLILSVSFSCTHAQPPASNNGYRSWDAQWITVPNENPTAYGVYFFRRTVELNAKPSTYVVHVSGDNRYKLYVNGQMVSAGPARSDLYYWNYETVDLAPYLKTGKNIIAALVWNEADARPEAQISLRTGFILKGDSTAKEINTNHHWRCLRDSSRSPLVGIGFTDTYYVAGPGEIVDMNKAIKNWMDADYNDSKWFNALQIDHGNPKGKSDGFGWALVPSTLPQSERTLQRIPVLRKTEGMSAPTGFPNIKTAVTIPANSNVTMLLDQTYLTNALVSLKVSGGKGASVSLSYAEALFKYQGKRRLKTNRDSIDHMVFLGRKDSIICDGSPVQNFTTMTWRTYRYLQVRVHTGADPLIINDLYGTFTAYPFVRNAELKTANPEIQTMLDIGWRTARLCSFETYMDCPYYEQLQYIGDSRIQALVSYYNSGDARLAKNAINEMDHSRLPEGITQSRAPSYSPQIISTFSLWYVAMLHDYWMYRNDAAFVKDKLHGTREILNFFNHYQQADGSLYELPYWSFVDWIDKPGWSGGTPPRDKYGWSAILDMQLLMAYQMAGEMEAKQGLPAYAALYKARATQLTATIQRKYWDGKRGLYADNGDKTTYSQHVNALAVLTGLVTGPTAANVCKHLEGDSTLTEATIYFKYYVHQAMIKGGLGNDYLNWLEQWRKNIRAGLTTWAETSDLVYTRSDCHAWGASPNIEFFRTLLGVDSDAPGFSRVKITPHLGALTDVSGSVPHPAGKIDASYKLVNGHWRIAVDLPVGVSGVLVWKGLNHQLKAGRNVLVI